jgi:abhydrolase domain-containing protein 17
MLDHLRSSLKLNIMAVEYPGYGIYEEQGGCDADKITQDCDIVYKFILQEISGVEEKDLILFGRSMGSGPASFLASQYRPGALILMSPYTSIKNVVKSKVGWLLSTMVAEHFDNLKMMSKVVCPTFIVHG